MDPFDLDAAISAFDLWRVGLKEDSFPPGYRESLVRARDILADHRGAPLTVEVRTEGGDATIVTKPAVA